jgi:hypothetical protein
MLWGIWKGKFWESLRFELGDEKWEMRVGDFEWKLYSMSY